MERKILITKRKKAKELKAKGWSCRKISRYLVASKDSVGKWVSMNDKQVLQDNRGWEKGKLRTNTEKAKERIISIRKNLIDDDSFFYGAKVVQRNYRNKYEEDISKWFIDTTLRESGLAFSPKPKQKGRSKYMNYPVNTLNKLGKIMMSIDFIGPKYLGGSDKRINFLSCKYIRPQKEGIVKRIEGQTTEETINILKQIWKTNTVPHVLKIDNDSAFGANLSNKMCLGRLSYFLLNLGVTPLYVAPRSPWNNGEVEGFNSVFSKKFWNHLKFKDEDEIDVKIKDFNLAYKKYSSLIDNNAEIKNPVYISDFPGIDLNNKKQSKFKTHKICFLRIVRRTGEKGNEKEKGYVDVLGKKINLRKDLINLFVFCELNIKEDKLVINTENNKGQLMKIKQINFKIKNVER